MYKGQHSFSRYVRKKFGRPLTWSDLGDGRGWRFRLFSEEDGTRVPFQRTFVSNCWGLTDKCSRKSLQCETYRSAKNWQNKYIINVHQWKCHEGKIKQDEGHRVWDTILDRALKNRALRLIKCHLSRHLREVEERAMWLSGGSVFHIERTVSIMTESGVWWICLRNAKSQCDCSISKCGCGGQ